MLTDAKLKNLRPAEKPYKVADRDGLYVAVTPSGGISFRYNYRVSGRQETVTLGRYGVGGMTLFEAREALARARKAVSEGVSPARLKDQVVQRRKALDTFAVWAEQWLEKYKMADSTRAMRRFAYERDLKKAFGSLLLSEISDQMLRSLCDRIVARNAPAVAVHVREIVMLVFRYAETRGEKHPNPADAVPPSSIATFEPRDRVLTPAEIKLFYLTFDIPQSLHARIKARCAAEEKFMNDEIIKLLEARWPANPDG